MSIPGTHNRKLRPLLALAALATAPRAGAAQATNPAYLSEMPSVEGVTRKLAVSDPRQTAFRRMGAFFQLVDIIKAMAGPREFGNRLTPDENRLIQTYNTAEYRIAQAADSAFPGPYGNWKRFSLNTPYAFTRDDRRFGVEGTELFARFFTAAFRAQFDQALAADKSRHQAFVAAHPEDAGLATAGTAGAGNPQSFTEAFNGLVQAVGSTMKSFGIDLEGPQGLRMAGTYTGASGLQLTFGLSDASISCGSALNQGTPYTVELNDNQVVITFPVEHPVVLVLRPDGTLVSPGSVTMTNARDNTTHSCAIGVLSPPARAPGPAAVATQTASSSGPASLSLATAVFSPAGALVPVPSRNFMLLNDNLETLLKQAGFQAAPGASLLKTMALCQVTDPNCKKGMAAMTAHGVAVAMTDAKGKATFSNVAAGTYYLVGAAASNNQPIVWNLRLVLKPGANSVSLEPRNSAQSQ